VSCRIAPGKTRERIEKPAKDAERGTRCFNHIRQGVQIPPVLNLLGDDILAGAAGDGAAHVRGQEVMNGPVSPAHARAHGFLLDVWAERRALLGQLDVEGEGRVTHGVEGVLVAIEEHLLGVLAEEFTHAAVHGLLLGSAHIFAEDAVSLLDQLPVDVDVIGRNDGSDAMALAANSYESMLKG